MTMGMTVDDAVEIQSGLRLLDMGMAADDAVEIQSGLRLLDMATNQA